MQVCFRGQTNVLWVVMFFRIARALLEGAYQNLRTLPTVHSLLKPLKRLKTLGQMNTPLKQRCE